MVAMKVLLWTTPRSVSTAFERSIRTLSNTKAFHEPFALPFYYGPERQNLRFASTPVSIKETYQKVKTLLCNDYDGIDVVFSKDMAYYVENKFDLFLDEEFKDFKHSFLIRDPAQAIPSFYRGSINPELPGYDSFYSEEVGFRQLYEFYQFVTQQLDPNPVVVDVDDLLDHPADTMKSYCEAVGITYEAHMTTWEPGPWPDPLPGFCKGWHTNVEESSGFKPRTTKKEKTAKEEVFPEDVVQAIEESTPYYKYLKMRKISHAIRKAQQITNVKRHKSTEGNRTKS